MAPHANGNTIEPGVTGWTQLCRPYGADERDAAEKLQYDLFIFEESKPAFYPAILPWTIEVVLCGKGRSLSA
ncbi:MAG: UDP-phosphate galactose phosphotransferase [Gammaproteobacteria bacterium]